MRKTNNTFLWMLTLALFIPLAALADDAKPTTVDPKTLSPADQALMLKKYDDAQAAKRAAAITNTIAAGLSDADAAELRKSVDAKAAQDKIDADAKTAAAAQTKADEKAKATAGMTIARDITAFDDSTDGLKKLIPDAKLVYDRAAGKDYTASVHLEGSIPQACVDKIGRGVDDFIAKYDGSQKIDSLSKLDVPFRGWNFKTSDAAQACVDQFIQDKKDKKATGYCKTVKFPSGVACLPLRDITRISKLDGGPKVGFYTCEGDDSDCKVQFYGEGKSADDVKRVADSAVYDSAGKRIAAGKNAGKVNLKLWKIKNVDQCYGTGKKMSLSDFFSDVADVKSKLKDKEDLSPYIKKGLNNEINRLKQLAESGKSVSDLAAFSSEVAAFYTKYLATSRSDVPNPDLDLMRRATLALFKTMERRVLDDDSAAKSPSTAKSDAETIISNALSLSPDDINLKNELGKQGGIAIDIAMKGLGKKQAAYNQMLARCQQGQQGCDPNRLQQMYVGLTKANQQAMLFYQKLELTASKACATGKKASASKDPFDDGDLFVDGSSDDDDDVTFKSRCDAAQDNKARVYRRLKENSTAQSAGGAPDPRIVQQLAQGINGANALPNATIVPGQNGYNPALAFAMDPNRFPGNFNSDYLRSLAPQLQPSSALGTGQMCLTGVGSVSNCFATGNQFTGPSNQVMVSGANMPPAMPVRQM